jgi:tRNA-specific 2-thiouridylase
VVCNREVKFGTLLSRALAWEADGVATGHYARLVRAPGGGVRLCRARDRQKDQSYFLWPLTQAQLERAYFPIGEMTKAEVRARARALGLVTADTPESQELCFVRGDYRAFLRERAPEAFQAGPILDGETGREVGVHAGLGAYTIGQRKGLGAAAGRRYVIGLDPRRNAVVVGPREALDAAGLVAQSVNWIAGSPPAAPIAAEVRIRHNAPLVPARVEPIGSGEVTVRLATPQRAVTPGQSVVFYRGDEVLGGGVIERAA